MDVYFNINISKMRGVVYLENIHNNENKIIKFVDDHYKLLYILLLLLLIFNVFYKINTLNINFDEARHGISAYEMLNKKQYIVNTFEYKNDYWNLKPILSFLPIMLGYKIAGFNMVGLRLFSTISTILTFIAITIFVKNRHGKLASLISFTVLATNVQYIIYHCSRSAEADAVYMLFFTLSVICMSLSENKSKYLYLSAFLCSLAFLTKSFHVISLIAILTTYIFLSGTFRKLKLYKCFLLILSFLLPILLWGILRFHQDGMHFFEKMVTYDLLDRSSNSIEGHTGGVFYYILTLIRYHGAWLILLTPCTVYFVSSNLNHIKNNKYIMLIILWIIVPLILYTIAKTKIEWYILPVYPPIAICCGALFSKFVTRKGVKKKSYIALTIIFLFIAFSSQTFILHVLINDNNDPYQSSIKELSMLHKYDASNLYMVKTDVHPRGIWSQTDILAAELYGNFKTKNGGFHAFLRDKGNKAVIILPENFSTMNYVDKYSLKVIARYNNYLFLSK